MADLVRITGKNVPLLALEMMNRDQADIAAAAVLTRKDL